MTAGPPWLRDRRSRDGAQRTPPAGPPEPERGSFGGPGVRGLLGRWATLAAVGLIAVVAVYVALGASAESDEVRGQLEAVRERVAELQDELYARATLEEFDRESTYLRTLLAELRSEIRVQSIVVSKRVETPITLSPPTFVDAVNGGVALFVDFCVYHRAVGSDGPAEPACLAEKSVSLHFALECYDSAVVGLPLPACFR